MSRSLVLSFAVAALVPPMLAVADEPAGAPVLLEAQGTARATADGASSTSATVDPAAVDSPRLRLLTGADREVTAVRTQVRQPSPGFTVWRGVVPSDRHSSVTLVRHDGKVTGSLLLDGQLTQLLPSEGTHQLVRGAKAGKADDSPLREAPGTATKKAEPAAASVIDVLVAVTPSAAESTDDVQALAQLAVEETNQGYAASGVDAEVALAGVEVTGGYEDTDTSTDLDRLTDPGDGYLDEVPQQRDAAAADVAVLIGKWDNACGTGWINAGPDEGFVTVDVTCATGYYSFAHEIGHLLGARHNPEQDDSDDRTPTATGTCSRTRSGARSWPTTARRAARG